ncbi:tripartite tricarboxylate transporter permease [Anaerotalea alkaliphila]|uniref:Tripartite tricarboxylate transporter permease n=1 Tax=Anaerotalea alkaliphila TaxID=2662126 RepID=A0A7X5HW87_9FIRM|nr:tripartite tricarboxylate transporter permease [Anaerotalea alkaliphila]NDL67809.1 tripartite tricarboxylate transporter permease [Anaerotalea alkaliphila]
MSLYIASLLTLLEPLNLLLILAVIVIGTVFGAIPGLSGAIGIALLLPITIGMSIETSFAMLLAMYIGGVSGSFIGATLIGIPGSSSSIATTFDAFPMTQRGEASKALTIGILASFVGTFGSILIATFLSPVIADFALKLGPWEYASLCFCALTLVAALSKGSVYKCLLATALGLLLGSVGMDQVTGVTRFTFGNFNLNSGISVIAITLGVFACQQVASNYAKGTQTLPKVEKTEIRGLGIGFKDITEHIGTILRSFSLGMWIGFLPGMGSGVSNLIAYAHSKSSSKHSEKFGTGYPGGIWASETSNNAAIGGAIIPMMALGIPGDSITAMLLTGLMIHGLQPGPLMITSNPEVSYLVFAGIMLCCILVLVFQLFAKRWFPLILKIPYRYLYSVILIITFIGAYGTGNNMYSIYAMLACAVLGIVMHMAHIPTSPFLLAFILSGSLESYFRKGISYASGDYTVFLTRPLSLLFLLIGVGSILWPLFLRNVVRKTKNA